jgi:uridine kinase
MAKIIGISGISGAGTTTTTRALGKILNATTIYWDDFDDVSSGPGDYVEWFHKSGDYADWQYPALEKTLHELKKGLDIKHPATGDKLLSTSIIIFDSSLGRKHEATGKFIDFMIHIDTSMDVALARRLVRDYRSRQDATVMDIVDELEWYLRDGRPLFDAISIKETADFVVNGDLSTNNVVETIMAKLRDLAFLNSDQRE